MPHLPLCALVWVFPLCARVQPTGGKIGGRTVNFRPPRDNDSPLIRSELGGGIVFLRKGDHTLKLDVSDPRNPVESAGVSITREYSPGIGTEEPIVFPFEGEKEEMGVKDPAQQQAAARRAFQDAATGNWREILFDACTGDWQDRWFLDGEVGTVETGTEGMTLTAGPEIKNDAHHMVLWTKASFEGDLKIDYEYTRLDSSTRGVNIIYIEATGSGEEPYVKDIAKWSKLRRVPAMRMYFDHMHTYHISYAASPGTPDEYIRARRYMPNRTGLKGTKLAPDYRPRGLFETGVTHRISIIKQERDLFMRIENAAQVYFCHMTNPDLPPITEGRIGLRHMWTRSSRYKNFRVSVPE